MVIGREQLASSSLSVCVVWVLVCEGYPVVTPCARHQHISQPALLHAILIFRLSFPYYRIPAATAATATASCGCCCCCCCTPSSANTAAV